MDRVDTLQQNLVLSLVFKNSLLPKSSSLHLQLLLEHSFST